MKQATHKTLGELKKAGYGYQSTKQELRKNLAERIAKGETSFKGIIGYDDSVLPDIERAILSGHNINLLGLRGQAKTRIARSMTDLLDEWVPYISGSPLFDDPFAPISTYGKKQVEELQDKTPISWLHRDDRYAEKLATPDVTIADLIGDIDPIKAANMRLSYADEEVIHYGIIPRSNRHIFVINELPDLQARIQVALFNILQEGDIQIRGFKLRIPLDIQFVFTANPEDYTNRGSIVTPLKDRIGSQIVTHYPLDRDTARKITAQEAKLTQEQRKEIKVPELALDLIEQISLEARDSEFVDVKSGVSARLSISALENLVSAAERRLLKNKEKSTTVRISNFQGVIPAITGKVERVYEGEQEGAQIVAQKLLTQAIRTLFAERFSDPEKLKKKGDDSPYAAIESWFNEHELDILHDETDKDYTRLLKQVDGLEALVKKHKLESDDPNFLKEFVLHGLAAYSKLNKRALANGTGFSDLMSSFFNFGETNEGDPEEWS